VTFTPGPASADHSIITADAGPFTVDPTPPSAGLTVQLRDAYDNNLTSDSGYTLVLTPSAANAAIHNQSDVGNGTFTATVDLADHVPTQLTVGGTLDGNAISTGDAAVNFLPGALASFTIDAVGNQTAGTAFTPTFRAFDQYGNAKTDYDGGASVLTGLGTSPGCSACNPQLDATAPSYGTLTWADGTASPSVTAYDADAAAWIRIDDGDVNATSDPFAVTHATALKGFTFTDITNQTAGTSFGVSVQAYDLYGNTKTDQFAGTLSGLGDSPGCAGCFPTPIPVATPIYGDPLSWSSGTGSTTITGFEARTDASLTITDTPISNTTTFVEGPAALGGFTIATSGTYVAGSDITVTVTAHDIYGNVKTGYTSGNSLTGLGDSPACPNCSPPILAASPDYGTLVWNNGVGTATVHAYLTGSSSVSFSANGFSNTSPSFTVTPAALGGFTIATIGNQVAGTAFDVDVTATAYDLYGNVKTDYSSGATVGASASNPLGTSPKCSTCGGNASKEPLYGAFTWGEGTGIGTASVTAYTAETGRTVKVSDSGASVSNTSNSFDVAAAAVYVLDFSIPSSATATDDHAGWSGEPNTTKKGTPIYHICTLPGSGTDPCNTASAPVQVLARDQYGNVTPGVTVALSTFNNPGTGFTGTTSAVTSALGYASFGNPTPLLITPSTATGTARLQADVTAGPTGLSATFQVVDDLEACANATCDNLATSGQTSYSRIDATGPASFGPVTTGLLDGVSLVTQFQPANAFCGQNTAQVGRTTDVHVEALGGVPTLNFKVALIVPKSLLQASGYASRNSSAFNVCFGATYLGAGTATPWKAKTSPTNATLIDAVPNSNLYWGWLPDCNATGKKAPPPALTSDNPCIVLRTKNAKELQAALGLTNAQFATLGFASGDLAVVYQTRTPWDAKGSIF
jgi:hypothetical protein